MMELSPKQAELKELRAKGYRITPQRKQILSLFDEIPEGEHLSADELFDRLKEKSINISLATLYRTLKFLSENGFLRELDFGEDHKHYELINDDGLHHHHLICTKCNLTIEFSNQDIVNLSEIAAAKEHNFLVTDYQFEIFGLCEKCRNNEGA